MPKVVINKKPNDEIDLVLKETDNGFITQNFEILKKIIHILSEILTSITFNFSEEGIDISCMDSNHICYIKSEFPDDFFENYNCVKSKSYSIPINVLDKIFSITKSSMNMKMVFHEDNLDLEFQDDNTRKYYEIKLIDLDMDQLEITDSENYNYIHMNSREFNTLCREINDIGSVMSIECFEDNSEVIFESEGDMAKMRIIKENRNSTSNHCKVSVDVKYMHIFSKISSLTDRVSIRIADEYPLKISYEFIRDAFLQFYLSPKITE